MISAISGRTPPLVNESFTFEVNVARLPPLLIKDLTSASEVANVLSASIPVSLRVLYVFVAMSLAFKPPLIVPTVAALTTESKTPAFKLLIKSTGLPAIISVARSAAPAGSPSLPTIFPAAIIVFATTFPTLLVVAVSVTRGMSGTLLVRYPITAPVAAPFPLAISISLSYCCFVIFPEARSFCNSAALLSAASFAVPPIA